MSDYKFHNLFLSVVISTGFMETLWHLNLTELILAMIVV